MRKLPRYFKDADKVMDLEQRLLWCMENVQGLDTKDVIKRALLAARACVRHGGSRRLHRQQVDRHEDRAAARHPRKRKWPRSAKRCSTGARGVMDFSCATCHGDDGQADPAAGAAELLQARQGRAGDDGLMADLSRVAERAAHDAAPAVGLLPPAAHGRCPNTAPTASRRSPSISTRWRRAARSPCPRSSAERERTS